MNSNLLFDFTVNKENKTIHVKRQFDAQLDLVWRAWTTAELLDQWWAPLPYRNETKTLEFREGSTWHYRMISPENQSHYCRFDYEKINPEKSYSGLDAFCDEEGNLNTEFSRMHWKNEFTQEELNALLSPLFSIIEIKKKEVKKMNQTFFLMVLKRL